MRYHLLIINTSNGSYLCSAFDLFTPNSSFDTFHNNRETATASRKVIKKISDSAYSVNTLGKRWVAWIVREDHILFNISSCRVTDIDHPLSRSRELGLKLGEIVENLI